MRRTEGAERGEDPAGVLGRPANPDFEIARGPRYAASPRACAPTTRYSAPAALSADNISTKSRSIDALSLEGPGVPGEALDEGDPLRRRHRRHDRIVQLTLRSEGDPPHWPGRPLLAAAHECVSIPRGRERHRGHARDGTGPRRPRRRTAGAAPPACRASAPADLNGDHRDLIDPDDRVEELAAGEIREVSELLPHLLELPDDFLARSGEPNSN